MYIKNRKISNKAGFNIDPDHPEFVESLDPGIQECVCILVCKGYNTTASCEGHIRTPYIKFDPADTPDLSEYCKFNPFVTFSDGTLGTKDYGIFSYTFLRKRIKKFVDKIPEHPYHPNLWSEYFRL